MTAWAAPTLAVVGVMEAGMERAMGIEPTTLTKIAANNHRLGVSPFVRV
jgi:hypothetical protein